MRGIIEPNTVIGERYRLVEKLGAGGMGVVYRAVQLNLDREVAVKILLNAPNQKQTRTRFEREARVAASLRHKNVVEIYDVGEENDRVYIVMELLRGQSLADITGGDLPPLPLDRTLDIVEQLTEAISAAHRISLVHRDLKPENVFLETDSGGGLRVCVVDFGLAFIAGDETLGRVTREGLVVGTPGYISPEQAQGVEIGTASDVYSLGCLLYEMLTGHLPFRGSELNVLTQHIYVAPESMRQNPANTHISYDLDALVLDMLHKRSEDRPSIAQVRKRILDVRQRNHRSEKTPNLEVPSQPRSERMLVPNETPPPRERLPEDWPRKIGIFGQIEEQLHIGLLGNRFQIFPLEISDVPDDVDVVFAVSDNYQAIAKMNSSGTPVIAAVRVGDMDALANLARLGVSDIVNFPLAIDQVVKKITRAYRRAKRKSK